MIQANVLKSIQQVLGGSGIDPQQEDTIGFHLAQALHVTEDQANRFLTALNRGSTVDDATLEAEIDTTSVDRDLLTKIAQAIGHGLGQIFSQPPKA